MLCRPHSALGCPAQLRLAGSGLAARACLYVHDRVSGWAPRKICTFRRIFSCLPGFLEKCCGLTPPFDDLARPLQRPLAVPPPLGGECGRGLLAGARINGRAQSFFLYMRPFTREHAQNKKSPPKRARRPRASRKWSGREKEESKVPPKIDHPPTAATGEITKCWRRLMMGGEGCVAARDAAVVRVRGDFFQGMSGFLLYILFVLCWGWVVQFLSLYMVIW